MLHTLGWTSLEHRRATSRLCMLLQIYHGSIGIPHDPYILPYRHTPRPSSQTDICTPSQHRHTSAGLTILNVPSSPKQLLLAMPSLKVWSLAPHWMHSRRHCHWGDRYWGMVARGRKGAVIFETCPRKITYIVYTVFLIEKPTQHTDCTNVRKGRAAPSTTSTPLKRETTKRWVKNEQFRKPEVEKKMATQRELSSE